MAPNLRLYQGSRLLFSSEGKWLHPLFELEDFLSASGLQRDKLELRDRIMGRAAALLMVRLGLRRVHAEILSLPGKQVLEAHGVSFSWDRLVTAIGCQTESALAGIQDPQVAYAWLRQRAGR
jgi:zinc transport system ATP-binding protein